MLTFALNAASAPCTPIVLKQSIGPFKLYMDRKEVAALGKLEDNPSASGPTSKWVRLGTTDLILNAADRVLQVMYHPKVGECFEVNGQKVTFDGTLEPVAGAVGACGPWQFMEGGSVLSCSGLDLMQAGPVASPELRISDTTPHDPVGGVCAAYVVGGKGVVPMRGGGLEPKASVEVKPGTQVCLGATRLNSTVTPKDIYSTFHIGNCTESKTDHVEQTCPTVGAHFVFSREGLLKSVDAVALTR
jgi:hypothetical protein